MSARESALELLSHGVSPGQVANTLGVTPAYISQLLAEEDFAAEMQSKRAEASLEDMAYDKKLAFIEETYLDRIAEKATFANLQQSMQAFRILNTAKRKKDNASEHFGVVNQTVNLVLPAVVLQSYQVNTSNEIVEVEGKTMVSATPRGLDEMMLKRLPPPNRNQEKLIAQLKLTGLESARETLEAVRPAYQNARKVPKYLDIDEV